METSTQLLADEGDGVFDQRLKLIEEEGKEPILDVQAGFGDPRGFEGCRYRILSGVDKVRDKIKELQKSEDHVSEWYMIDVCDDQSDLFKEKFGWDVELILT